MVDTKHISPNLGWKCLHYIMAKTHAIKDTENWKGTIIL